MGTSRNARLLMLLAFSSLAWKTAHSTESCDQEEQKNVICALPEEVAAASTKSVGLRAGHLRLGFEKECKDYPGTDKVGGRFRTADGTCNHPFNLGAANRPPKRLLPNAYEDGLNAPRTRGVNGSELPSASEVSRIVHRSRPVVQGFTVILMQWGQFLDHDMTGMPISSEVDESIECCENGEVPRVPLDRECVPIELGPKDRRFKGRCMEFARSVAALDKYGKKIVPREQVNSVTSFIDGSMIYGSSQELQEELRFRGSANQLLAFMRLSPEGLLPNNSEHNCIFNASRGEFCFLAGDTRVNEQTLLAAIHTMFVRIHNIIVQFLSLKRPNDSQEELFQLTRKILVGMIQNVHYGEWLPLILGRATMRRYGLTTGFRSEYVPTLDPRIANAFSTAAYRFGHSLIPDVYVIGGKRINLRNLFGRVGPLFDNFNDVVLAMAEPNELGEMGGSQRLDGFFTEEITEHLFETKPLNVSDDGESDGLDLVSLNIQRGRDHGLPSYNHFRKFCGLPPIKNFTDFPSYLGNKYSELYGSVDDIDLFSAMMHEPRRFGLVGETLACLLGNQFHDLKFGDRFFFETNRQPEGFSTQELAGIRNITMAHLCCMVKGTLQAQKNLFLAPSVTNPLVDCSTLRFEFFSTIDLFKALQPQG